LTQQKFLAHSTEELVDAETLLQNTEKEYATVLRYFAEDSKMQPEEFFAVFKRFAVLFEVRVLHYLKVDSSFNVDLQNACKDIQMEREMADRAAKRANERRNRVSYFL
jgi:hypothetical protein